MKYKIKNNCVNLRNEADCVEAILHARGIKNVEEYLHPTESSELDWRGLVNIDKVVDLIVKHGQNGSRILILIDADVDGCMSSAITWLYLKEVFPEVKLHFLNHEKKAHGFEDVFREVEAMLPELDLIIEPDAGGADRVFIEQILAQGIDVLQIDHHLRAKDEALDAFMVGNFEGAAFAITNNQSSPDYENKTLCGAGVVYKVLQAVDARLGIAKASNYIDLVALAEIGDVMSQVSPETRYYITHGLRNIKNEGLKAFVAAQSFNLKERAQDFSKLTPTDAAFYLCPLMNAYFRVATLEEKALLFLAFVDPLTSVQSTKRGAKADDKEIRCEQAARMGGNIRNRQNREKDRGISIIEGRIQENGLLEDNILFIEVTEEDKIPSSLTGLIAAHFVTKYNRPCLIGRERNDGDIKGSIRGNNSFEMIPDLKGYLDRTGYFTLVAGHENAAGFAIPKEKVEAFIRKSNSDFTSDGSEICYEVDYVFDATDVDFCPTALELAKHPNLWGNGVDEPRFIVKGIKLFGSQLNLMGANKDSAKFNVGGVDCVRFKDTGFIERIKECSCGANVEIYGRANLNEWNGQQTAQLFIDDYNVVDDKYSF